MTPFPAALPPFLLRGDVPDAPLLPVVALLAISPPFLGVAAIVALARGQRSRAMWLLAAAVLFVVPTLVWASSDGYAALGADLVVVAVLGGASRWQRA